MTEKALDINDNTKQKENEKEEKGKELKNKEMNFNFLKMKSFNAIKVNNKIIEKFSHRNSEIIPSLNNRINPLKNCILALSFPKDMRFNNPSLVNSIESYLKTLPGFMNIISTEQSKYNMEEKIKQIAMNMNYEYYNKNTIMFKYGERGDKFYIILKGKIGFLIPKKIKCNLNEEEYLGNLLKLHQNGEHELLRNIMRINQQVFDFGDDLEKYIAETLNEFYKHNKKYKYSIALYKKLIELSSNHYKNKSNLNHNNISIQAYIDLNKAQIVNQAFKNKRQVVLYNYQYVNNYQDGQTFGYMALESRSNKRTSTAITITDCELASLDKEGYVEFLGGIHHKTRNNLYELITSLKVLGNISKPTFDYDVIHKIKFINYKTNDIIIKEKKILNLFYIFYSGSFKLEVKMNITGLNELIIKLKKIRGKILGIPDDLIQKDISDHLLEINGSIVNKKYNDESIKKEYFKKHNFIVSIITDNFLLGLPDTVDPDTNLTLFNCSCISNYCDGYEISNKVLKTICKGERYKFNNDVMHMSLTKINYYINRIIHYKNTLLLKIQEMKFSLNKIHSSISKQKKSTLNEFNSETKIINQMYNTETNFLINNINNNTLICKTSGNLKTSLTNKTKNSFNLKFMSFPSIIKKNIFSKSISHLKRKVGKKINTEISDKKRIHKEIENIFKKKEFDDESSEGDQSIIITLGDNEQNSPEKKTKIRKKVNVYNKLNDYIAFKQKEYKNNSNSNKDMFNPVDDLLKKNKVSRFIEYKDLISLRSNLNGDNKYILNSCDTINNIDYFLYKGKKMKDSIILDS